ncbi:hypothetical protein BIY22_00500 [Vibrio panuliri]|uniref:DUF2867 domain-containing protein n=1 Tax=Vibrio panuliri TaxID=1381081 RepID=A0A1Q9HQ96_9VIBR|nr:DUF2867 domain-containing protein [Vibrio panuliri]OLQ93006.1 hypothetical protein BIY22_00500 [Vibrio panuliri]
MVKQVPFPQSCSLNGRQSEHYYRDTFVCQVTLKELNAIKVYHSIFAYLPVPIQITLKIRNSVVKHIGFSSAGTELALELEDIEEGKQAGFLVYEKVTSEEIIASASEENMDMWIAVQRTAPNEYAISTLVNLKTKMGRAYMALIKPFHKIVARYCIQHALKTGRI